MRTKLIAGLMALSMAGAGAGGLVIGGAAGVLVESVRAQAAPVVTTAPAIVNTANPLPGTPSVSDLQAAVEGVYAQANPSVVYIVVQSVAGGRGFGYVTQQASGSGFVYDSSGHIVTNAHVVDGAQQIEVVFSDGSQQSANLIGEDTANDLAVIQVSKLPASAKPLSMATDGSVQVGEFVAAIGSPFGEQNSMSFGIVSGLNRTMDDSSNSGRYSRNTIGSALNDLIQTDAPINPGNSGGPLLNLNGQVVGVDNAIESASGSNSGVGFAIPASVVQQVVPNLISSAS